jgi:hypothetical protein
MSILLRTLTKKSTFNFGKYKDCTVGQFIGMRKQKDLISMYYKLSTINFNDEILEELGIIDNWVINKPSTDKDKYLLFLDFIGYGKTKPRKDLLKMRKETKNLTKGQLQTINHLR